MIETDVVITHYFPFHEHVCEVNGSEQFAGTLERIVLKALNVDLHDGSTERHDINEVVKHDCIDDGWTRTSALLYLQ